MWRYFVKRLGIAVLVVFTVSVISFGLLRLSGDLAQNLAGEGATQAQVQDIRVLYGLDRPLPVQYVDWAGRAITGDLGRSLFTNDPVFHLIAARMPVTAVLALGSLLLAICVALPLGVFAAVYRNSWIDRAALGMAVFGSAVPSFWFALILIYVFGVQLRWLPISGSTTWWHFVLPMVTLSTMVMPQIMRLTRGGMIEALDADYVKMAWAKGLNPGVVFFKHALRNALLPVVALAAVSLGFLLGGSVIVESVFSLNGIGSLAYESIKRADFPVVQSILFVLSFIYVLLTLLSDLINARIDPRIRLH
ncbi:MAG: ABC transporter permease [Rhodobacter sp.]|nr:ABC transporter permease [Paracoccaceae bacterium]MCC0077293.1 ABC transporter permease [Rhodobacter sp.]